MINVDNCAVVQALFDTQTEKFSQIKLTEI